MLKLALETAGRLGLEVSVNLSSCAGALKGPWEVGAALPPAKRFTKTNVALQSGPRTLKAYQGFASEDPLMTSGLLGPARLQLVPAK